MSYKVGNEEIIVKCIPDFDDTTWLDEENNLHKTIHMSVNNIEKNGIIRGTIGKNNYTLVAKELNIMYYQIKKLELKGVLKINDDLYCEERSDVFLHIYIKDFCFDW
jgi:methylthioribose-1-phosphate isomerase